MLTILRPLDPYTWLCLWLAFPCFCFCLFLVAWSEEEVKGRPYPSWARLGSAVWYGYATFLGESVTRDTDSSGAWGIRYRT